MENIYTPGLTCCVYIERKLSIFKWVSKDTVHALPIKGMDKAWIVHG